MCLGFLHCMSHLQLLMVVDVLMRAIGTVIVQQLEDVHAFLVGKVIIVEQGPVQWVLALRT